MIKKRTFFKILTALLLIQLLGSTVLAAGNDNNVEWNGVGHQKGANLGSNVSYPYFSEDSSDPNNKAAIIRLRVYQSDLTSANVVWTTNASASAEGDWTYTAMSWEANVTDGATTYDSWKVTLPSTKSATVYYKIQMNDGTKTNWLTSSGEGAGVVSNTTSWTTSSTSLTYTAGPLAITLANLSATGAMASSLPLAATAGATALAALSVGFVAWRRRK